MTSTTSTLRMAGGSGETTPESLATMVTRARRMADAGDVAGGEARLREVLRSVDSVSREARLGARAWGVEGPACPSKPSERHRRARLCGCDACLVERVEADARVALGMLLASRVARSDASEAVALLERALPLVREAGRFAEERVVLETLWRAALRVPDYGRAMRFAAQAVAMSTSASEAPEGDSGPTLTLTPTSTPTNDSAAAKLDELTRAQVLDAVRANASKSWVEFSIRTSRVEADLRDGARLVRDLNLVEALEVLGRALEVSRLGSRAEDRLLELRANARVAVVLHAMGRSAAALAHLDEACLLSRRLKRPDLELPLLVGARDAAEALRWPRAAARFRALATLVASDAGLGAPSSVRVLAALDPVANVRRLLDL